MTEVRIEMTEGKGGGNMRAKVKILGDRRRENEALHEIRSVKQNEKRIWEAKKEEMRREEVREELRVKRRRSRGRIGRGRRWYKIGRRRCNNQ